MENIGGLTLNINATNLDCVKNAVIIINNHVHDYGGGVVSDYDMKILKALLGEHWYREYSIGKRHIENIRR